MTTTPPTGPAWSVRAEYASIASPLYPVIVTVSASIASYIRCPPSLRLQPAPCFHGAASAAPAARSGIMLPEVSLGLWQNFGDTKPLEDQRAILRRAFDLRVTHFDLANNYGAAVVRHPQKTALT